MRRAISTACLAILFAGLLAIAQPALAADDTFVSATGTDAGACTIAAPCRTLNYALAQTTAGGTIIILTSGHYAPVTINKSVHIMADGVEAVLTGIGACDAVVCIDAGLDDIVSLRGITILVPGPYQAGSSGVAFLNGAGLHFDKSAITGIPTFGILFYPNSPAHLHVFDSKIVGAGVGIEISAAGGALRAVFDRIEVHDGSQAIVFQGGGVGPLRGTVRNSLIASHHGFSVWLAGDASSIAAEVMLDRTTIVNGVVGVGLGGGGSIPPSKVRVGDSVFSGHHQAAVAPNNAAVLSYGTNKVIEGIDGIPFPNTIPLK